MPKVSIIIPSYDGYREGNVPKLLDDIQKQTFKDYELIVIKGVKPNGRARNVGVEKAKGEILVFIDDDTRLGNEHTVENLVKPFTENNSLKIGITGASRLIPLDSNWFQKLSVKQLPRTYFPVVNKIIDTDMATHDCMAIPKKLYRNVGGEHNELLRGTDPDLRYRIRKAGLRVVVVPDTWIYHPVAKNLKSLIKKSFNNGLGSGWVMKNYPELVYEVPEDRGSGLQIEVNLIEISNSVAKRNFIYRINRSIIQIFYSFFTFRLIFLVSKISYIIGYTMAMLLSSKKTKEKIY